MILKSIYFNGSITSLHFLVNGHTRYAKVRLGISTKQTIYSFSFIAAMKTSYQFVNEM